MMKNKFIVSLLTSWLLFSCNSIAISQILTRSGGSDWFKEEKIIRSKTPSKLYQLKKEYLRSQGKTVQKLKHGECINISSDFNKNWIADDHKTSLITLEYEDAQSISLFFDLFKIPKGDSLYLYNKERTILVGPFTYKNNPDGGKYTTGPIDSDNLILEYHAQTIDFDPSTVMNVSQVVSNDLMVTTIGKDDDRSCLVDAACNAGNGWDDQKRSVIFTHVNGDPSAPNPESTGTRWASAVLLNNTANDNTPYVLTARHTLDGSGSNIDLMVFRFRYWNTSCGSNTIAATISYIGGEMLESWPNISSSVDVALVRMFETPDPSDDVFFAGWDRSGNVPTQSAIIGHPADDFNRHQKIALSSQVTSDGSKWWRSNFHTGGMIGGGSGAPIFNQNGRLIATHKGRYAPGLCDSDGKGSKLHFIWNNEGENGYKIGRWLDPLNTGATSLDGRYPDDPDVDICNGVSPLYVERQTFGGGTNSYSACEVQTSSGGVAIAHGATLIIDSKQTTTLNVNFSVSLGGKLEVK